MKLSALLDLGYSIGIVGTKVGPSLVRQSPLLGWLTASGCTHVAMEATGVYWKPVWNILSDGDFELIVANAAHIKNVPGRKTDVNDATWIADLVACGLIRELCSGPGNPGTAFVAARPQATDARADSHVQRIQKTLEEANIKLIP